MFNPRTLSLLLTLLASLTACTLTPTFDDEAKDNDDDDSPEQGNNEPPQNSQAAIPPEPIAVIQESCWSAPYLEIHTDESNCTSWSSPTLLTLYLGGDLPPTSDVTYAVGPLSGDSFEIPSANQATGEFRSGSLTIRPQGDEYVGEYDVIKTDGTPLTGTFRSVFCEEDWGNCGGF